MYGILWCTCACVYVCAPVTEIDTYTSHTKHTLRDTRPDAHAHTRQHGQDRREREGGRKGCTTGMRVMSEKKTEGEEVKKSLRWESCGACVRLRSCSRVRLHHAHAHTQGSVWAHDCGTTQVKLENKRVSQRERERADRNHICRHACTHMLLEPPPRPRCCPDAATEGSAFLAAVWRTPPPIIIVITAAAAAAVVVVVAVAASHIEKSTSEKDGHVCGGTWNRNTKARSMHPSMW